MSTSDEISIHSTPPPAYAEWLTTSTALFDNPVWGEVLAAGFGVRQWYIWDERYRLGHALSVFRKGPLRIGYLGFPICADTRADAPTYSLDAMVAAIRRHPHRPDVLRIPVSAFGGRSVTEAGRHHGVVEHAISELSTWRAPATSTRRRDLAFARRRCGNYESGTTSGANLHAIYRAAVARNRGRLRYTTAYFDGLAGVLHGNAGRIHCRSHDGEALAMAITARHGDTEYYLHAGTSPSAMGLGLADLLIADALGDAQVRGARRFNFLSSPASQPGLMRFKQKWGGEPREASSHDVALSMMGAIVMRVL